MNRYLISFCFLFISSVGFSQELSKNYYTKYYTPIYNDKLYFDAYVGALFPSSICGQQPSLSAYIESPFKGNTGLGLRNGVALNLCLKGTPGKTKEKYKNIRIMPNINMEFATHGVHWNFSNDIKLSNLTWMAMGTGIEMGYNLKNILVISSYYKILLVINYNYPELLFESGIEKYSIKYCGGGELELMNVFGLSAKYRKHLNIELIFRNTKFHPDYDYNNVNNTGFRFPGMIQYSSMSIQLGYSIGFTNN